MNSSFLVRCSFDVVISVDADVRSCYPIANAVVRCLRAVRAVSALGRWIMRLRRYEEKKSLAVARRNRLEIVEAQLSRREMIRSGLIGGAGYLAFKNGLSQWASGAAWASGGGGGGVTTSPPTRSFIEPM